MKDEFPAWEGKPHGKMAETHCLQEEWRLVRPGGQAPFSRFLREEMAFWLRLLSEKDVSS